MTIGRNIVAKTVISEQKIQEYDSWSAFSELCEKSDKADKKCWTVPKLAKRRIPAKKTGKAAGSKIEKEVYDFVKKSGLKPTRAQIYISVPGAQAPVPITPDIVLEELGVVVEIDGPRHAKMAFRRKYNGSKMGRIVKFNEFWQDCLRTDCLKAAGYRTIRLRGDGLKPIPGALNLLRDGGGINKPMKESLVSLLQDFADTGKFPERDLTFAAPVKTNRAKPPLAPIRNGRTSYTYPDGRTVFLEIVGEKEVWAKRSWYDWRYLFDADASKLRDSISEKINAIDPETIVDFPEIPQFITGSITDADGNPAKIELYPKRQEVLIEACEYVDDAGLTLSVGENEATPIQLLRDGAVLANFDYEELSKRGFAAHIKNYYNGKVTLRLVR